MSYPSQVTSLRLNLNLFGYVLDKNLFERQSDRKLHENSNFENCVSGCHGSFRRRSFRRRSPSFLNVPTDFLSFSNPSSLRIADPFDLSLNVSFGLGYSNPKSSCIVQLLLCQTLRDFPKRDPVRPFKHEPFVDPDQLWIQCRDVSSIFMIRIKRSPIPRF